MKHGTNVFSVEIVRLIRVNSRVGAGTKDDPVRAIYEYFTLAGDRLFIDDGHIEFPESAVE